MRFLKLAALAATALTAFTAPAIAQTRQDDARFRNAQDRFDREMSQFRAEYDRYMSMRGRGGYGGSAYDNSRDRPGYLSDPYYREGYDPVRDYRDDSRYQERSLGSNDYVYRGNDGRYYCRRNDGTTGLIVGAGVGGILGNVIDGGRNRVGGTLIGGALGALAGRAVEQNGSNSMRCR